MLDINSKSTWSRAIVVRGEWRTGKDAGTLAERTMRGSAERGGHSAAQGGVPF